MLTKHVPVPKTLKESEKERKRESSKEVPSDTNAPLPSLVYYTREAGGVFAWLGQRGVAVYIIEGEVTRRTLSWAKNNAYYYMFDEETKRKIVRRWAFSQSPETEGFKIIYQDLSSDPTIPDGPVQTTFPHAVQARLTL